MTRSREGQSVGGKLRGHGAQIHYNWAGPESRGPTETKDGAPEGLVDGQAGSGETEWA
jgi:hypothetical protein